jgi:hypothetical protein
MTDAQNTAISPRLATSQDKPLFRIPLIRIRCMSEISSARKWDRSKLIQNLVSGATGLLLAVDLLSVRVPLYFFGQATDRVGEVFHSVARLVRHGLSDAFDQIETGTSTLSDALSLVCTAILAGAGFVFLRRAWRSLAILRPGRLLLCDIEICLGCG